MAGESEATESGKYDDVLYSRQLYVYGEKSMKQLRESTVLICGLDGVGVEIAKNIILSGVGKVVLYDKRRVSYSDASSGCFFDGEMDAIDSGRSTKGRGDACIKGLSELNRDVVVVDGREMGIFDVFEEADVIVSVKHLSAINGICRDICRRRDIKHVHAEAQGVFGRVFCDFGEKFTVTNPNCGELTSPVPIVSVSVGVGSLTVECDGAHHLGNDNCVKIEGVKSLDPNGIFKVTNIVSSNRFDIVSPSGMAVDDETGMLLVECGVVTRVEQPIEMSFKSARESCRKPDILQCDPCHPERASIMHHVFRALSRYDNSLDENITLYNKSGDMMKEVLKRYKEIVSEDREIERKENEKKEKERSKKNDANKSGTSDSNDANANGKNKGDAVSADAGADGTGGEDVGVGGTGYEGANNTDKGGANGSDKGGSSGGDSGPSDMSSNSADANNPDSVVVDEKTLKILGELTRCYGGRLVSMCSVIGGIAAQEVIKACTGTFVPIHQWLYFESIDSLPGHSERRTACCKKGRHGDQAAIFGESVNEKILSASPFVVGSGAIGCELLKNFVAMGMGSKEGSAINVSDDDVVSRSNLNRQFLFREADVGLFKAERAKDACLRINPHSDVISRTSRVCHETESVYNSAFFKRVSFVANALDNRESRRYVSGRCVDYGISLIDSGTLGSMGSTQVSKAHLTATYDSQQDPVDATVPVCTIRNFPSSAEHTILWARDMFEEDFVTVVKDANRHLKDPEESLDILASENAKKALSTFYAASYNDCLMAAYNKWNEMFNIDVKKLLLAFPKSFETKEGTPFWSGVKRCPTPLTFSVDNPDHMSFVSMWSQHWAIVYGVEYVFDSEGAKSYLSGLNAPSDPVRRDEGEEVVEREDVRYVNMFSGESLRVIDFDKDDDNHVDMVNVAASLRAENYGIDKETRSEVKRIAGSIIPAIPTTTSIVAGLVALEAIKILQSKNKVKRYRDCYINLALPMFAITEPAPATSVEIKGNKYTEWDKFTVIGDRKISWLLDEIGERFHPVSMILKGTMTLYTQWLCDRDKARICDLTLVGRIEEVTGESYAEPSTSLNIILDDGGDDWVSIVVDFRLT